MGLYIDFPFCIARCAFCAFHVQGFRSRSSERYLSALKKEIRLLSASGTLERHLITSIYLGGGTPTQYSAKIIGELIGLCHECFTVSDGAEISLEAHPATLDTSKLLELRKSGVNRLSLGVQSFSDIHLKAMGRHHTAEDADIAFHAARSIGFDNIGIDLIYGLPNQSEQDWINTIRHVIKLAPDHLSVYALSIENGTLFGRLDQEGKLELPDEDTIGLFYDRARTQFSMAGYTHYEISNFSKPDKECLHNLLYWDRGETMGFGLAAHSYLNLSHRENTSDLVQYIDALEANRLPPADVQKIDLSEAKLDRIIFGLRKIKGLPYRLFEDDPGLIQTMTQLEGRGLLKIEKGWVSLSDKGLPFADELALAFL